MNKNRTCPPEFIGENRDPRRYPAPNTPPKPKFIDALEITDDAEQYSTPVKKDPKTGLLYSNAEHLVKQSDDYHTAEEARLDGKINQEIQDRYAHVMAIDEVNQHRVNDEKTAREAEDLLLNKRVDDHEQEVDELHAEADRVHNSKLDKNFANADISTLPVSSSDYVVIVSNGNTYRVTLEQLATLISQKTDYFKGQYISLDHLNSLSTEGLQGGDYAYVDTEFTDNEGNTYYQFVTYVWDVEDARWEETKSSQYATQADYTALVQALLDGTFNLGSIKANSSPEGSPLLKSLHVNQRDYSLPSVELEFSDEVVENGYRLGSIKIGDNTWNVPNEVTKVKFSPNNKENGKDLGSVTINNDEWNVATPTQIKELEQNTKVVDKEFKEFKVGEKFPVGYELTVDNSNGVISSKTYVFSVEVPGEGIVLHFYYYLTADGLFASRDDVLFGDYEGDTCFIGYSFNDDLEYVQVAPDNVELELIEISDSSGSGLLGVGSETQLTAQEVYDNTKFKDKVVSKIKGTPQAIYRSQMPKGLYEVTVYTANFNVFSTIFYWKDKEIEPVSVPIYTESSGIGFVNCFLKLAAYGIDINIGFYDEADDSIAVEKELVTIITRIL